MMASRPRSAMAFSPPQATRRIILRVLAYLLIIPAFWLSRKGDG